MLYNIRSLVLALATVECILSTIERTGIRSSLTSDSEIDIQCSRIRAQLKFKSLRAMVNWRKKVSGGLKSKVITRITIFLLQPPRNSFL